MRRERFIRSAPVTKEICKRAAGGIDRAREFSCEHIETSDMIHVLVGNDNRVDRTGIAACLRKPVQGLLCTQAASTRIEPLPLPIYVQLPLLPLARIVHRMSSYHRLFLY